MNASSPSTEATVNLRRVVTYERVSTLVQQERQSILTQNEELARHLAERPDVVLVKRYKDEAVSGTVAMRDREGGGRLLADAARHLFDEVWMFKLDRMGRDDIDPLLVRRELERYGVRLYAITENIESPLEFGFRVLMAAEERRNLIIRTTKGMARAVREGRYPGGIRPFGYRVEGDKHTARLAPNTDPLLAGRSEADIIRLIYERLALDHRTCWSIADELNMLGVPTVYAQEGRGQRKRRVRGVWTPGRIRNMVVNPIYRGEFQYGKRSTKPNHEVISVAVPALVSAQLWHAALEALARNSVRPKNSERVYLLSGLIECGNCGHAYCGTVHHRNRDVWYRCNGMLRRLGEPDVCHAKGIKGAHIEPAVWTDIERFLRDPGDILDELRNEDEGADAGALLEAERTILEAAISERSHQRLRMLDAYKRGLLELDELESELGNLAKVTSEMQDRLASLVTDEPVEVTPPADVDLLAQIRTRLDEGLSAAERQEIARLLVRRILVHTHIDASGTKQAHAIVEYRLPEPPVGVVQTCDGMGS